MPKTRKVYSPFKLQITWLEPDSDDQDPEMQLEIETNLSKGEATFNVLHLKTVTTQKTNFGMLVKIPLRELLKLGHNFRKLFHLRTKYRKGIEQVYMISVNGYAIEQPRNFGG